MEFKFFASFNKQKKLVEWQDTNNDYGYEYCKIDQEIFNKISAQIQSCLGVKEKYSVQDAIKFYREYYFAYPIRLTDYYDHMGASYTCHTEQERFRYALKCDNNIDALNKGVVYGTEYCYIADLEGNPSTEKSVTLVIPTSYCSALWDRYPEYLEKVKQWSIQYNKDLERLKEYKWISPISAAVNIIIVIGSLDGTTINSMKFVLGDYDIPEVDYSLEFFRLHS